MNWASFFHIDAGNVSVLIFVLLTYRKISIKDFQHGMMWRDYEKRHGMNGYGKKVDP
jgi:hypothetical protein